MTLCGLIGPLFLMQLVTENVSQCSLHSTGPSQSCSRLPLSDYTPRTQFASRRHLRYNVLSVQSTRSPYAEQKVLERRSKGGGETSAHSHIEPTSLSTSGRIAVLKARKSATSSIREGPRPLGASLAHLEQSAICQIHILSLPSCLYMSPSDLRALLIRQR